MSSQTQQLRAYTHQQVTIVANTCESPPIDGRNFFTLQIHTPAVWTASAVGIKVSPVENTLYKTLYSQEVGAVRTTSAIVRVGVCSVGPNNVYVLPHAVEGSAWFKLWSHDGSGVDEDQAADRVLGISLKG